jgi:hypothetical protein
MKEIEPHSREEIFAALKRLREDGLGFWAGMDSSRFASPFGEAWSPADNVRHLIKSTLPVTKGLKLPGFVLRMLFGAAREPSQSYTGLRTKYQGVLAAGGKAGRFAPQAIAAPLDGEAWQHELVSQCREALSELARAAERWSEHDLDRYRLPHPLLGKLTLREMLFFTLYHYAHHTEVVVRKLAAAEQAVNPTAAEMREPVQPTT